MNRITLKRFLNCIVVLCFFSVTINAQTNSISSKVNNYTFFSHSSKLNIGKLWLKQNAEFVNHPDVDLEDKYMPNDHSIEIISKRDSNYKYYIDKDQTNRFYLIKSLVNLHYKKNGNWLLIDTRLQQKTASIYEASRQEEPVGFDLIHKNAYIKTKAGKINFNNWKLYGIINGVKTFIAKAVWNSYTAGDDGVKITNIFKGIDAEMEVKQGAIKTNFIIRENNYTQCTKLIFTDVFSDESDDKFNIVTNNNELDFKLKNHYNIHLGKAIAYTKISPKESTIILTYTTYKNQISFTLDELELNAALKNGNTFIIDPLVSTQNSIGGGLASGSDACQATYTLAVTPPAAATITNITQSVQMSYNAISPGNVHCSISLNNCSSGDYCGCCPGASNPCTCCFNAPQNGIYAGSAVVYNSFSSCLPLPSCNPGPINFLVSVWDDLASGCNSSYSTGGAFSIIIEGHTVELNNISSNTTICVGQSINLNCNGIYGVPPYTYSWNNAVGNGQSVSVKPSTTTTYTCTITDQCNNTANGSVTINVNPVPVITSANNNSPVCSGNDLNFTANSNVAGSIYNWSGISGFTSGSQNPTINNAQTSNSGSYTVTATANGCTSSAFTIKATVNQTPTVTLVSSNSPLCTDSNGVTLHLFANSDVAGSTFSWQGPNGFISSGQNPTLFPAITKATGVYTVLATANNCNSVGISNTSVFINPIPELILVHNNSPVCSGNDLNFTANSNVTGSIYNWSGISGFTSGSQNPTINNAQTSNSGSYTITATANGCTSSAFTTKATVNQTPTVTLVSSNSPLCTDSNGVTLHLFANSDVAGSTFSWQGPNGFISSGQNPTLFPVITKATGVYTVVATANNCNSVGISNTSVFINPIPEPLFVGNNSPLCEGDSLGLVASYSEQGCTFNWDGPNGFSTNLQNPSIPVSVLANKGTYIVSATKNGCTSPLSNTNVIINSNPVPNFDYPFVCETYPGDFYDKSTINDGTGNLFKYLWTFGDGKTDTLKNPVHIYNNAGFYNVTLKVTSNNGCTKDSTKKITISGIPKTVINNLNTNTFCSNNEFNVINNSSVTYSNIVSVHIVWDYPNGKDSIVDNNPILGKNYNYLYTVFGNPKDKKLVLKYAAYSDVGCFSTIFDTIILKASPRIVFPQLPLYCVNHPSNYILNEGYDTSVINGIGYYTGNGVVLDTEFNASVVGVGTENLYFHRKLLNGCEDSLKNIAIVGPSVSIKNMADIKLLYDGTTQIFSSVNGGNTFNYLWTPSTYLFDSIVENPYAMFVDSSFRLNLQVTNEYGCIDTSGLNIIVVDTLPIPNVFSPNGDGIHDFWDIKLLKTYPKCWVQVFDRNGQQIFNSFGYANPWDGKYNGKDVPIGTYYYIIKTNTPKKKNIYTGSVTIIR